MKVIYALVVLAVFLVACGDGMTGEVVLDKEQTQITKLEQEIDALMGEISAKQEAIDTKVSEIADLEGANDALGALVAKKDELLSYQQQILHEMEDEKNVAVSDIDDCEARVDELESKNEVLQKWVDICREDLAVSLD